MKTVHMWTAKAHDILLGEDFISSFCEEIRERVGGNKVLIVTDDNVKRLYGKQLKTSLESVQYHSELYSFPAGEKNKSIKTYEEILSYLCSRTFTKGDLIIGFGGGVSSDMAGFVASTYMRGMKLVQIPTTLLGAIDASIGGKNGVNMKQGKNLVGTIYQPDLVIIDTAYLEEHDSLNYRNGMGEMVKYTFLHPEIASLLLANSDLNSLIQTAIEAKKKIVELDEREGGSRRLLNLGHTIGHAIEKASDYKTPHGLAVSIGLAITGKISLNMGLLSQNDYQLLLFLLEKYQLPTKTDFRAGQLMKWILSDKKRDDEGVNMVFPLGVGKATILYQTFEEINTQLSRALEDSHGY